MSDSLFSPSWYRVADLRPRLRGHARIHRHVYRGRPWYVLQDVVNQRFLRFPPAAQAVIGLMDGERTVQQIWEIATETLGDDAPTQDEMIRMLSQLHGGDVLQSDVPPDALELLERHAKRAKRERLGRLANPFAIRIPLVDPERFLVALLPWLRPILGWGGLLLWLAVVIPAGVLVGVHWSELTEGMIDRILMPGNLILIWLIFPLIKILHELGHGILARQFGGEIHDMGVMLLVFTPIPYVDASSASAFRDKRKRALVGAGGMLFEIFLAALAVFVWTGAEPGTVRALAYNTMLIAGVTTLAFNANPLLRFDGYYILSDWLEIPNLRGRANAFVGYLVERYAFGRREADSPEETRSEQIWLVSFAVASFLYRVVVIAAILLLILDFSLVLGVLLGALAIGTWMGVPLVKGVRFLLGDPRLRRVRGRAIAVTGTAVVLLLLLVVAPAPFRTQVEGVVWIPDEALIRARAAGFVERVVAESGSWVEPGDVLIECRDPDLQAEVAVLRAQLRGLDVRFAQAFALDRARAGLAREARRHVQGRLTRAEERLGELSIRSPFAGTLVLVNPKDLPGRFVPQGALLAYVVDPKRIEVRAVVPQQDIELIRNRLEGVSVRLSESLEDVVDARLKRVVPAASATLPSVALGSAGGGAVTIDPRDEAGTHAIDRLFVIELTLPDDLRSARLGGRVYLRMDHGYEPLAMQGYRELRQIFLSRLDV